MENSNFNEIQLVVFKLNELIYAVDIMKVQEIIKLAQITELANSPEYILGVVNLRGKIIPIMDLRKKFSLSEKVEEKKLKILILKGKGTTFAIVVDMVTEVRKVSTEIIERAPKTVSGINDYYINGIAKTENGLVTLLDIDKLIEE